MKINTIVFLLFITIMLSACSNKNAFIIKGDLANTSYEGETIYLVSKNDKNAVIADSTKITKGEFAFKGNVEEPKIFYINIHPVWPQLMQELMLIVEPGSIKVTIDTKSYANGTHLNEILENWKELKLNFDYNRNDLYTNIYKVKKSENPDLNKIETLYNEMKENEKLFIDSTSDIILKNNQNVLGQYLLKIYFNKIEHERKVEILSTAGESFLNDEKIQKLLKDIDYKY